MADFGVAETDEPSLLRLSQDELAVIAGLLEVEDLGVLARSCKTIRGALLAQLRAAYAECLAFLETHAATCILHPLFAGKPSRGSLRSQSLGDRGVRMFAHLVRDHLPAGSLAGCMFVANLTDQGCSADVALKMCEAAQAAGITVLCSERIHPRIYVPTDLHGRTVYLDPWEPSGDPKYRWTDADAIFVAHSLPALERPVELQLGSSPSFAGGVPARHEIGDKGAFALAVGLQRTRGGVAYANLLKCRFGVQSAWALVAATEPAAPAAGGGGGGKSGRGRPPTARAARRCSAARRCAPTSTARASPTATRC